MVAPSPTLPSTCQTNGRGYYTGWLQTSPTLGIVVSLGVIIGMRASILVTMMFNAWAWRVPFLVSFLLVAIAIWIRLQLQETPIFAEIKAKGQMMKNPWKEAFGRANIKYVLIATVVLIGKAWSGTRVSSGHCTSCSRFPRWTR